MSRHANDQDLDRDLDPGTGDRTFDRSRYARPIDRLIAIMAKLRDPEAGCPWDVKQTFATIAPYTIEEAYEVADAIARGDLDDLEEELGDLLLQVVFHARMAEEAGRFTFEDVADAISEKLLRRHPHVFGDIGRVSESTVSVNWEAIKAAEKAERAARRAATGEGEAPSSVLDDVPVALPALARARKLQKTAATVGFDWPDRGPVLDKMAEELAEFAEVAARPDASKADLEDEFGDLLFTVVNLGRHLGLDAEAALSATNEKFVRRFRCMEAALAARGTTPEAAGLAAMEAEWQAAKAFDPKR